VTAPDDNDTLWSTRFHVLSVAMLGRDNQAVVTLRLGLRAGEVLLDFSDTIGPSPYRGHDDGSPLGRAINANAHRIPAEILDAIIAFRMSNPRPR